MTSWAYSQTLGGSRKEIDYLSDCTDAEELWDLNGAGLKKTTDLGQRCPTPRRQHISDICKSKHNRKARQKALVWCRLAGACPPYLDGA